MEKDVELAQVQRKLENQEPELCQHRQQKEKLQQQYDDIRKTHQLEITAAKITLSNNREEIYRLRNHNKKINWKN